MSILSAPLPWLAGLIARVMGKGPKPRPWLPRTLSFTKEGKRFIILLLLIGIAAINTGNNLLYLIVAMMLSLIIVSGIMSESTLRSVHIKRALPRHIFAGRTVSCHWVVKNGKGAIPSFSLWIEEIGQVGWKADVGYYIKIPSMVSLSNNPPYIFEKRGRYRLEGFKVSTRFPFGLFIKARVEPAPLDVLVYPKVRAIEGKAWKGAISGELPERMKGVGSQLYNLREYTFGDDSRAIHWRATAKTGRLITKEFEREGKRRVIISLDNTLPLNPSKEALEGFEETVEEAASLAYHFIKDGVSVGLKTREEDIPCKVGMEHLYRILRSLALVRPVEGETVGVLKVVHGS